MKNITYRWLLLWVLLVPRAEAQKSNVWITNSGELGFFSETPVENIAATNKQSQAAINPATYDVAVRVSIRQFDFPNKLMQEHFNENYLESEKYPTATFKGKIQEKINWTTEGSYDVTAKGTLTIHGQSKERILKGNLTIKNGKPTLTTTFEVPLEDHQIEVPSIVFVKIARVIQVKGVFIF
jgi:polyisoprenoid-binding protein YceI